MGQRHTPLGLRALAAATAVLAITSSLVNAEPQLASGRARSYAEVVLVNTCYWGLWALFAPVIARATQRFPFERRRWLRPLFVHMPLGFGLSAVHVVAMQALRRGINLQAGRPVASSFWSNVRQTGLATLDWNMMAYWMIVGAALAAAYREEARLRQMAAVRLETELVQAQLRALQSQLHPHFLFNALNAVSALMHRDVELADQTLSRLAGLLRSTLRDPSRQDVALREELDFTRNYLQIEQTRFRDRLTVRFDIPAETLDALVPWMLLQPLVENAVKHGIAPRSRPGTIEVVARRERDRLRLVVRDDGAGLPAIAGDGGGNGIGLKTTRARLEQQFGRDHEFAFTRLDHGVEVRVGIPWRPAAPSATVGATGGDGA